MKEIVFLILESQYTFSLALLYSVLFRECFLCSNTIFIFTDIPGIIGIPYFT